MVPCRSERHSEENVVKQTKALESIAYHEAGHAVAAHAHQVRTKKLTIVPAEGSLGRHEHKLFFKRINIEYDSSPRAQRRVENMVIVCLAGPAAQRRFNPRGSWRVGAKGDWHQVHDLLSYLVGSEEQLEPYWKLMEIRTQDFVQDPDWWFLIERVAHRLLDRQTLTGAEVRKLMISQPGEH